MFRTTIVLLLNWPSEWLLLNRQLSNFSTISWRDQINFHWDVDEVLFVLDQHAELDFYCASSLKQQSADRHVAPLKHLILISSQPVFVLSPWCCVLSGEATHTNFMVFGLTRSALEPMIFCTRGQHANHYNHRWVNSNNLISSNPGNWLYVKCGANELNDFITFMSYFTTELNKSNLY